MNKLEKYLLKIDKSGYLTELFYIAAVRLPIIASNSNFDFKAGHSSDIILDAIFKKYPALSNLFTYKDIRELEQIYGKHH